MRYEESKWEPGVERPHERAWPIKGGEGLYTHKSEAYSKLIKDGFWSIKTELEDLGYLAESLAEKKAKAAPTEQFSRIFKKFRDEELPRNAKVRREITCYSDDTVLRWCNAESAPLPEVLKGLFRRFEEINGRPVPAERRAELLEALQQAREVPRTLKERLKATQEELAAENEQMAKKTEQGAALVDRADALQKRVASLEQQLLAAGFSSGGFNGPSAPQPSQYLNTNQQEQELLRKLAQANADLKETLEQQQQNYKDLVERARKVTEVVDHYILLNDAVAMFPSDGDQ